MEGRAFRFVYPTPCKEGMDMDSETTLPPTAPGPEASPNVGPGEPPNWGPLPEEILDEWRWIHKGQAEGLFNAYAGKHIAVFQQKVWESSWDPELLLKYVALKYNLDPERVVVAYVNGTGIAGSPSGLLPTDVPAANPSPQAADDSETPQDIIEWRWIYKGRRESWLAAYVGQHIAVMNEKVIASHESLERLNEILEKEFHLDPAYVVRAVID
jgi:hypothetical protein